VEVGVNKKGFSLIQLVLVMAMVGLLSSVALVSLDTDSIDGATSEVAFALRKARDRAITEQHNVWLSFVSRTTTYQVHEDVGGTPTLVYESDLSDRFNNVQIRVGVIPINVTFDSLGRAIDCTGDCRVRLVRPAKLDEFGEVLESKVKNRINIYLTGGMGIDENV
jgi:type II secretory pathway pseudopilin PulG